MPAPRPSVDFGETSDATTQQMPSRDRMESTTNILFREIFVFITNMYKYYFHSSIYFMAVVFDFCTPILVFWNTILDNLFHCFC